MSKGGMVVGIHKELKLPIKFIGLVRSRTICNRLMPSNSRKRCSTPTEPRNDCCWWISAKIGSVLP